VAASRFLVERTTTLPLHGGATAVDVVLRLARQRRPPSPSI